MCDGLYFLTGSCCAASCSELRPARPPETPPHRSGSSCLAPGRRERVDTCKPVWISKGAHCAECHLSVCYKMLLISLSSGKSAIMNVWMTLQLSHVVKSSSELDFCRLVLNPQVLVDKRKGQKQTCSQPGTKNSSGPYS